MTGAAGFIGSHLVDRLLDLGQDVIGFDNLSHGRISNLEHRRESSGGRFDFIEGDIRDPAAIHAAASGADHILHQAALVSVADSVAQPSLFQAVNVEGTRNVMAAASAAGVQSFVHASSSAVYGLSPPRKLSEHDPVAPISPYGQGKLDNERDAADWAREHSIPATSLRYFNVYGPRQAVRGPYSGVIPLWISQMLAGEAIAIHGDGSISRDFCFVQDIAAANIIAALAAPSAGLSTVYNIGSGRVTDLDTLARLLRQRFEAMGICYDQAITVGPGRVADIRFSAADVDKAADSLGFRAGWSLEDGLAVTAASYAGAQSFCEG